MPKTFKFLKWSGKKAVALFVLTAMLVTLTVGTTIAYIIVKTQDLTNTFVPPIIDINLSGNEIENTGDIPVYVRAAIVPTWISESDGSTLSQTPTVEITVNSGWTKGSDGFYYYASPVAADTTVKPIVTVVPGSSAPEGYKLNIQVLSAAIQATPAEAVVNSWAAVTGINSDGTLIVTAANN